jgi:hypothetical protein
MIRITKRFYDDHSARDLEAPPVIRETKTHYYIDETHPDMSELISDAKYYVEGLEDGSWQDEYVRGIARSGRALIKAYTAESIK